MYTKHISLDGVINARDLGGRTGRNGVTLKEGQFFRTAAIHEITSTGKQQLLDLGIRHIIDLRSTFEQQHNPEDFSDTKEITVHSVPMLDYMQSNIASGEEIAPQSMAELYKHILQEHKTEFLKVFDVLANGQGGVVFHCSAGKDRTGLTAMLILSLAGASQEDIIADYALTEPLEPHPDSNFGYWILYAKPETMRETLDWVQEEYGGAVAYLSAIGVSVENQQKICDKLGVPHA